MKFKLVQMLTLVTSIFFSGYICAILPQQSNHYNNNKNNNNNNYKSNNNTSLSTSSSTTNTNTNLTSSSSSLLSLPIGDANSTEGRNSIHRKPAWSPPSLFGQNSLASLLDPLAPLTTFSRLPQHPPPPQSPSIVSPVPVYSQMDLTTDYSSTLPSKSVSTSFPSAFSTIDPLNNDPAPGAMSLLYVCKFIHLVN